MPTQTESARLVTQIDVIMEASYTHFTRAFESLLGRMPVEALSGLHSLSAQAAREQLASSVGPLDFTLFQKLDHGAVVAALVGRPCEATTYVFGNALIAVEMTRHVARAGLYVPLRLFVEAIDHDRVRITYDLPSSLMARHPGLFAVGDVRSGSTKRVAAAVGEGSAAVRSVHEYLTFERHECHGAAGALLSDAEEM